MSQIETPWKVYAARALTVMIVLYATVLYALGWFFPYRNQLTFEARYYGAKAYNISGNPYDRALVQELSGKPFVYPYVKPPLTVHLMRPFTLFEFKTALRIYLVMKVVTMVFLVRLWLTKFLKIPLNNLFLLICLFGFNFALFWDFWSGNINLFTHALIWIGLYWFMEGRYGRFATITAIAAFWKLTPIFFLGLLVYVPGRKKWQWFALGAVLFGALQGASPLLYPHLMDDFVESAQRMRGLGSVDEETGSVNQPGSASTLMFFAEAANRLEQTLNVSIPAAAVYTLFGLTVIFVVAVTIVATRRHWPAQTEADRYVLILFACLVYLLVVPRLLVYSYIIGLVPAYEIARRYGRVEAGYVLLAAMLIVPVIGRPAGINYFVTYFSNFMPLFLAYAVWLAGILHFGLAKQSEATVPQEL